MIVLRTVRNRYARERMHARITGLAFMAVIIGGLLVAACTHCPNTAGCPRLPFSLEPQS